jgi:hypothetical protein
MLIIIRCYLKATFQQARQVKHSVLILNHCCFLLFLVALGTSELPYQHYYCINQANTELTRRDSVEKEDDRIVTPSGCLA